MIFTPSIINNSLPEVSVKVADSGVPPVTYAQIKQSLGTQVYKVDSIYAYSPSYTQLIGSVLYNRYDLNGNIEKHSIITTVDPYQGTSAIFIDLTKYKNDVILNGNSTLQTTILPNTYLQFKLYCRRITNSFGLNMFNFKEIEAIFKNDFYKLINSDFEADGRLIILEQEGQKEEQPKEEKKVEVTDKKSLALLSLASFSFLFYLMYKNE